MASLQVIQARYANFKSFIMVFAKPLSVGLLSLLLLCGNITFHILNYSDYFLFTYCCHGVHMHVLVYVDDIIICGNDTAALASFKQYLGHCFHMKDLGPLKYFLGIEVTRSSESSGWFLSLSKKVCPGYHLLKLGYLVLNLLTLLSNRTITLPRLMVPSIRMFLGIGDLWADLFICR